MNCFRKVKRKDKEEKVGDDAIEKNEKVGKSNKKKSKGKCVKNSNNSSSSSDEKDGHGYSKKKLSFKKSDKLTPIPDPNPLLLRYEGTSFGTAEAKASTAEVSVHYGTGIPYIAYMPVSKNDPFYNMNHPRRGKAVIFNFDYWDNTGIPELEIEPRKGSEKDKLDLTVCLKKLGFQVEYYDNCKNLEFWSCLENLRNENHSDADCLLVAIFTHGERNTIFMSDGTQIPVNLVWEYFEAHSCPSLAGKPKIFFVQACRGHKYDDGTKLAHPIRRAGQDNQLSDVTDAFSFSYVIPNAADIIVAFSSPPGHYSWRNPERGSWFIQSICKVFNEQGFKLDLQNLLTTVAREVALNYESNTGKPETSQKKQVTSTSSTLIRTVLFKPKVKINNQINNDQFKQSAEVPVTTKVPLSICQQELVKVTEEIIVADGSKQNDLLEVEAQTNL